MKGQCRQKWFNTQQQQQDGDANGKSKSDDVNGDQLNGEGSSFVCVCSAAFCDEPEAVGAFGTDEEQIVMFVSDREQQRLSRKTSKFHAGNEHGERVKFYDILRLNRISLCLIPIERIRCCAANTDHG